MKIIKIGLIFIHIFSVMFIGKLMFDRLELRKFESMNGELISTSLNENKMWVLEFQYNTQSKFFSFTEIHQRYLRPSANKQVFFNPANPRQAYSYESFTRLKSDFMVTFILIIIAYSFFVLLFQPLIVMKYK